MFQKRLDDRSRAFLFLQMIDHPFALIREVFRHIFQHIGKVTHKAPAAIRQLPVFIKLKPITFAMQIGIVSGDFTAHQCVRFLPDGAGHLVSVKFL